MNVEKSINIKSILVEFLVIERLQMLKGENILKKRIRLEHVLRHLVHFGQGVCIPRLCTRKLMEVLLKVKGIT